MSTTALDVVSTSTHGIREIGRPLLPATQLVARLGANPTVTVPMVGRRALDVHGLWAFLAEPADFFAVAMPGVEALSAAFSRFVERVADHSATQLIAVTITVVDLEGVAEVVVTGNQVRPTRSEPVRIEASDGAFPLTRADDPSWRRMAARTTSKGDEDQLRRWLNGRGYADGVSGGPALGVPYLGALIFERGGEVWGLDNAEPTSILNQLLACGAIDAVRRAETCPADAERAWWISPEYERHPVEAVGPATYPVDPGLTPTFASVR